MAHSDDEVGADEQWDLPKLTSSVVSSSGLPVARRTGVAVAFELGPLVGDDGVFDGELADQLVGKASSWASEGWCGPARPSLLAAGRPGRAAGQFFAGLAAVDVDRGVDDVASTGRVVFVVPSGP